MSPSPLAWSRTVRQAALVSAPLLACVMSPWLSAAAPERTRTASSADAGDPQSRPRVLILGDSISIAFTPIVQELMQDEAIVLRPMTDADRPENCEGTTKGVEAIDRWLQIDGGRWDVIHFNFGLHDLKRVDPDTRQNSNDPTHPRQAEPEAYERNLRVIVEKLTATGAALVFATTTPVPEGGVRPHRDVDDPGRYNAIARRVMREHGIAVNDLYALVLPRLDELQQPVNVHFTADGSRLMADAVAAAIRAKLGGGR